MIESTRTKLERILRAKTSFSEEQIIAMSDADGWTWVYRDDASRRRDRSHEICFTGFGAAECEDLKALAAATGWLHNVTTVTVSLSYLCAGPNAGPAKLAKAQRQGTTCLSRSQFEKMVADGVLPPS